jgi:siroheme synthase
MHLSRIWIFDSDKPQFGIVALVGSGPKYPRVLTFQAVDLRENSMFVISHGLAALEILECCYDLQLE